MSALVPAPTRAAPAADDQADMDTLVDAAKRAEVQRIYASYGATLPTSNVGATAPQPEDGETEEEFAASTAPPAGGYRMVPPRMTLEEAKKRKGGGQTQPRRVVQVEPEWRAQVLAVVRDQGFEVAPGDYPIEAAWTMVPDIGLAWIVAPAPQ